MESIVIEAPVAAPSPPATVYPTIKESWAFLGWYLLLSLLVGVPILLVGEKLLGMTRPVTLLLMGVGTNAGLLGVLWWKQKVRWPGINLHGHVPGWLLLALPVLVVSADMVLTLVHFLHLPKFSSGEAYRELMKVPVVGFLMLCVAAPVLEELLLRGVVLQGLLRNFPTRPWIAIGQSALVFGVMHMNPPQSLATFFLGLLMGWLYYRTRSLWLCMGVHFLNNFFAFNALLYQKAGKGTDEVAAFGHPWAYTVVVVLSALVLWSLLWMVQRATSPPPVHLPVDELPQPAELQPDSI
ncbi:type II CAAX endopeptidase family protein [Hymenobacter endophyticus]|uniref:Type II CAAX endopeptidase family protein n=1 Tax=Hymenobacter endophyticus TaxID=3076335 RepID=A0ABU3TMW9_9BACT|nr:type II CAAX endopeptidase family protein [Hymenobacter endophyticus]MDU0372733.1 type II CAAX endopeptidase family protein [Hymenobacter endophyticus]